MIDALRSWIVTICTTVIFITAVEMILPENKMKNYAKFVMGLILMAVIVGPIIKIMNKQADLNVYISREEKSFNNNDYKSDIKSYVEKDEQDTLDQFKKNVDDTCTKVLKEKYPNDSYTVDSKVQMDKEKGLFSITSINVGVKENGVEKVKKIQIGEDSKNANANKNVDDSVSIKIRDCISNEIKIPTEKINVYKL